MPSLANGEVEGAGDAASWTGTFSCHPSFALVGSSTLKCRNGQWSSPRKPVCTGQYSTVQYSTVQYSTVQYRVELAPQTNVHRSGAHNRNLDLEFINYF